MEVLLLKVTGTVKLESESSITIDQLDVIMKNNNYVKDLFLEKTNSTLVKYNINN